MSVQNSSEKGVLLILACNLVIQRICITDRYIQYPDYELSREYEESRRMVQKIGNAFCVNIVESIELHDKVSIVVGIAEMIEEKQIVEVFRKLQKVSRYGIPKPIRTYEANLNNAIRQYESAMSEFSRLFKFKNMFNALEILVNIDGKDRKGQNFDSEVIRLDPRNCVDVEKWRDFYNRIKHAHKDPSDIAVYEKGEKDLNKELEYSRRAVQGILLSKLSSL